MNESLIGKCGFYCGSCVTLIKGNCKGCMLEHNPGDCYTRDCVIKKKLHYCGECEEFPCEVIMNQPHTTVLDKDWLKWKKVSDTNR